MGMSASQARLLSITGRLNNNEFRAQTITNSKLRLADKSQEISAEYIDALNSQKLMYGVYDNNGEKDYIALTANTILTFGDLKNQYSLVNSSGKILALPEDITNYKAAKGNMEVFLSNYVGTTDNKNFYEGLKEIYGENYASYFTTFENRYNYYNKIIDTTEGVNSFTNFINIAVPSTVDETTGERTYENGTITLTDGTKDADGFYNLNGTYNNWSEKLNDNVKYTGITFPVGGSFGSWCNDILSVPQFTKPQKPQKPSQDQYKKQINSVSGIWDKFISAVNQGGCWDEANVTPQSGYHIEHILTHLLNPGETYKTTDGVEFTMQSDENGHTSVGGQSDGNWKPEQEAAAKELREILTNNEQLTDLKQSIIDTYYKSIVTYGNQSLVGISTPVNEITFKKNETDIANDAALVNSKKTAFEAAEIVLENFKTTEEALKTAYEQAQQAYNEALADFNKKTAVYNASVGTAQEAATQAAMQAAETAKNNAETAMNNAKTDYETAKANRENYETNHYATAKTEYDSALAEQEKSEITVQKADSSVNDRMMDETKNLLSEIKNAVRYEWVDDVDAFNNAMISYNNKVADYNTKIDGMQTKLQEDLKEWANNAHQSLAKYKEDLDELNEKEMTVLDENDPKYQWYKNLWFRMGAGKTENFIEQDAKELSLLNNSEWLQFSLEHGILTIEQAQFAEEGSAVYTEMGTFDWVPTVYTNARDFVFKEDEVKIAIAEAKYKKEIREIENQDKKFDQDLKKLDTEHSALQTEYESIKEVMNKNAERSFKAFS